jgi:hemerythrin-like metal-binding protein
MHRNKVQAPHAGPLAATLTHQSPTPMITWSPRLETGHAQIDAEHRELIEKLAVLKQVIEAGAGRERIVELINLLQRYVLGHFAREETHMHRTGCPAYEENRTAHRVFERKLEGWLELLTTGSVPVSLLLDVHRESSAWIEAHILKCDCQLRSCRLPEKNNQQTNSPYPQI